MSEFLSPVLAHPVVIFHCAECGVNLRAGTGLKVCRKCGRENLVPER